MDKKTILAHADHTLLSPAATWEDIRTVCDDGVRYGTATVCIPPDFVARAAEYLKGRLPVCTVIGFPGGYLTTSVKCFEAADAIERGASEIDMVLNIGRLKDGRDDFVLEEIRAIKKVCGERILKVIIETCLLTDEEKVRACAIVSASGADFIKTSTGFSTGGATREDVALLRANCAKHVRVKASGGISSLEDAVDFISLGAERLGTSRLVKLAAAMEK